MDLSMLLNLKVEKPSEIKSLVRNSNKTSCTKGDFMITKSGKIVFSSAFRAEIELLDAENNPTGIKFLDIVDGTKMTPSVPFMFIGIVPGDAKSSPRASIKQEGKVAFVNKYFKQIANAIYGLNWEVTDSIEFKILKDAEIKTDEPKFYLPCFDEKGGPSYNQRNVATTQLFPFIPVDVVETTTTQMEIPFPAVEPVAEEL